MRKDPKYKKVVKAIDDLSKIVLNAKTVNDLMEIKNNHHLTFEIDGNLLETQLEEKQLSTSDELSSFEWFRVEAYKMLSYIYFRTNGTIYFDVWSGYYDNDFIDSMTIENFTKQEYEKEIKNFENVIKKFNN